MAGLLFYALCGFRTSRKKQRALIRSFFAKEEGQGLVEYALILVLIAVVVIGIMTALGRRVSGVFGKINSTMTTYS